MTGDYLAAAVSVLLGSSEVIAVAGRRVYIFEKPSIGQRGGKSPSVVLSHVSETPVRVLEGQVSKSARINALCWALRFSDAVAVANAVKGALNDYKGAPLEDSPPVRFWVVGSQQMLSQSGDPGDTKGAQAYAISIDFMAKDTV